jgi:hypothetical protein
VPDTGYWLLNHLDWRYVMVLWHKSTGTYDAGHKPFETAYLISQECLEADGVTLTPKGREALEVFWENRR